MRVGSLFSGIGGLDHGLHQAGLSHVFFCESDPWRRSVLAEHWPGVPIYDDVRAIGEPAGRAAADGGGAPVDGGRREAGAGLPGDIDLLCGGFPCQDLSVAGQRRGLNGERSGLFFEFARITESLRPRWLLVENVPGLLSSNGGRDFGIVLGTLADIGYGLAWRVVDSRFFGVPQRRRRVFIVGVRADGDPRAAADSAGQVLAVGSRCPRHPATRGEAGEDVAGTLGGGSGSRGWAQDTERMTFVPALTRKMMKGTSVPAGDEHHHLIAAPLSHGSNPNSNPAGRRREDDENLVPYTFDWQAGGSGDESWRGKSRQWIDDKPGRARSLVKNKTLAVHHGASVRRLTPTECERLQALPDGWTNPDGKAADSRRYAALGDAVTASVGEWIGRRLMIAHTFGELAA